ncbi:phage tail protein [Pseudomonas sp. NPDC087697]|uniref:phage tail protein n=1 Tax=Pseudomonas sp. NPDC087697 TaxID=3364447 RepID=UPI0037F9F33C
MIYASKETGLFYDSDINQNIPEDAVELSVELHTELMAGQGNGKKINFDTVPPTLIDRPAPSREQLAETERHWRGTQLATTDGVVARHRDELEEGSGTTLTPAQYAELQAYRRALRNWPEAGEFPLIDHRPPSPLWLTAQFQ